MKNRSIAFFLALALLAAAAPVLGGAETDPEAVIRQAKAVVLGPNPPEQGIAKVLADVLGASLAILPRTDYATEFKGRVEGAQKAFAQGTLFSGTAYQDLGAAYKLVSGGKAWQVPEELKVPGQGGIEQVTKICASLLDSALSEYKGGRNAEAVRDLLGFVILVVTPIER